MTESEKDRFRGSLPCRAAVTDKPAVTSDSDLGYEGMCQVVLYNDNHNDMDYVVQCLIHVFGHGFQLAKKITLEAHNTGRAVAEVEGGAEARAHCSQLLAAGLGASVERI